MCTRPIEYDEGGDAYQQRDGPDGLHRGPPPPFRESRANQGTDTPTHEHGDDVDGRSRHEAEYRTRRKITASSGK